MDLQQATDDLRLQLQRLATATNSLEACTTRAAHYLVEPEPDAEAEATTLSQARSPTVCIVGVD